MKCIVTGQDGADVHHIKTRGSGGGDDEWNLIPLCRTLHSLWHLKGTKYMAKKYPAIERFLLSHGWHLDEFTNKWIHHKN